MTAMRWFRTILRISYKDHVTNEEDRNSIQQEDHSKTFKQRSRSTNWSSTATAASQIPSYNKQWEEEEEEVGRRRGGKTRLKRGQGWSSPTPRGLWTQNRKGWGELVARSPVARGCPSDPYGLREREIKKRTHVAPHTPACVLFTGLRIENWRVRSQVRAVRNNNNNNNEL